MQTLPLTRFQCCPKQTSFIWDGEEGSFAVAPGGSTLLRRDLSSCVKSTGSTLGCLRDAVPSAANTGRAGAAACPAPSSVSHLRSQPGAKPGGLSSFFLQRTASVPPAGTVLGGSLALYKLSAILQGHSETTFLR